MSNTLSLLSEYISSHPWNHIPSDVQAMSTMTDQKKQPIISLSFTTHRDVITDIGYTVSNTPNHSNCPKELEACVSAVCNLASMQPVMSAELIGPKDIFHELGFTHVPEDTMYYFTVMAVLLLKDTLSSYAGYKKADLKQWEQEQNKGESLYAKYMD